MNVFKIAPCLWFDAQAEDAVNFYVSTFRRCGQDAEIGNVMRYTAAGGPHFTFSPAISLFVKCADQAEVDRFWDALSEGGQPGRCGWLTDRFGVSWQIAPTALGAMLQDADPAKAERAMQALMQMTKLDLAALQEAYQGGSAA
jgi:predicted 3-demethylubiquinone-9 3-methyltransferase (glyoxalase superfamily)